MNDLQKAKFTSVLVGLAGFYGTELSKTSLAIYWDTLREYDLHALQEAMRCHVKDPGHGRFMPKPADIIRHLPGDRVMGADAAWEIAMKSRLWDEDATIVVSRAVFRSFPFAIWEMGDKVGARMAFKDAWPAALAKYGDGVEVSMGLDPAGRAPAVLDAVRTGMIEQLMARSLLPDITEAEFALGAGIDEPKKLDQPTREKENATIKL